MERNKVVNRPSKIKLKVDLMLLITERNCLES